MTNEFTLRGIRDGEGIFCSISGTYGDPPSDYNDLWGRIDIRSGVLKAENGRLWTCAAALKKLLVRLEDCQRTLSGNAELEDYENNLSLTVKMTENGHAWASGKYRPDHTNENELFFKFETDQTCIGETIAGLRRVLNNISEE